MWLPHFLCRVAKRRPGNEAGASLRCEDELRADFLLCAMNLTPRGKGFIFVGVALHPADTRIARTENDCFLRLCFCSMTVRRVGTALVEAEGLVVGRMKVCVVVALIVDVIVGN